MNELSKKIGAIIGSEGITIVVVLLLVILSIVSFHSHHELPEFSRWFVAAESLQNKSLTYTNPANLPHPNFPPTTLALFVPFTKIRYNLAVTIFFGISLFSVIYSLIQISRITGDLFTENRLFTPPIVPVLAVSPLILHQLLTGSLFPIFLGLFVIALDRLKKKKKIRAGLYIGLLFLINPATVVLLIPLLICHRWRSLIPFLIVACAGWILFIPFAGGQIDAGTVVLDWYASVSNRGLFSSSGWSLAKLLYHEHHFSVPLLGILYLLGLAVVINPIWFRFHKEPIDKPALISLLCVVLASIPLTISHGTASFIFSIPLLFLIFTQIRSIKTALTASVALILFFTASLTSNVPLFGIATIFMTIAAVFMVKLPAESSNSKPLE